MPPSGEESRARGGRPRGVVRAEHGLNAYDVGHARPVPGSATRALSRGLSADRALRRLSVPLGPRACWRGPAGPDPPKAASSEHPEPSEGCWVANSRWESGQHHRLRRRAHLQEGVAGWAPVDTTAGRPRRACAGPASRRSLRLSLRSARLCILGPRSTRWCELPRGKL